jgi:hypothetical protein
MEGGERQSIINDSGTLEEPCSRLEISCDFEHLA